MVHADGRTEGVMVGQPKSVRLSVRQTRLDGQTDIPRRSVGRSAGRAEVTKGFEAVGRSRSVAVVGSFLPWVRWAAAAAQGFVGLLLTLTL